MSDQPQVSICIPSYNHARFLPAAIESALAQVYPHCEIIIADDGSTDGSLQVAEDYAARYPDRIQVLTHPGHSNRGSAATSNLMFARATGAYWMGLSSDDLLHPLKVAEQIAFLERHPDIGWVYGYAYCIDEHGRRRPELGLFGVDITRAPDPVERLIEGNVIPALSVLARRAALAEVRPEDETLIYSDWDFWVRLAARHRVAFMPRARVRFRVHSYNTSAGISSELNMRRSLDVMLKLRREADRIGGALRRPRTQALLELQLAYYKYSVRAEQEASAHLAAAFALDPTLQTDARYFVRWLKHCYRILVLMPERLSEINFGQWVLAHLPANLPAQFVARVTRAVAGRAFTPESGRYYRVAAHWQNRRNVLGAMLHDPRVWRERDQFALHVEALLGSRVRRQLRRLQRPRSAER